MYQFHKTLVKWGVFIAILAIKTQKEAFKWPYFGILNAKNGF